MPLLTSSFPLSSSVSGNSVRDHIHYLGISMHAESLGHCRIVTGTLQYKMDPAGNIVFSKQPGLSFDELYSAQWINSRCMNKFPRIAYSYCYEIKRGYIGWMTSRMVLFCHIKYTASNLHFIGFTCQLYIHMYIYQLSSNLQLVQHCSKSEYFL